MPRVLVTAFEPYDHWSENSSWLTLVELTKDLPCEPQVTTRRYPVDFAAVRERIQADLQQDYDYALHLGQAPGSGSIRLESIALNIGGSTVQRAEEYRPLVDDGPVAFRSALPLADWVGSLRREGIPAQVSYHAGTYLCNATLYLTHYFAQQMGLKTQATFIHLPLDVSQAAGEAGDVACLPAGMGAETVRRILHELRA